MGKHQIIMGRAGKAVAVNVVNRRQLLGLTQSELSEAVRAHGRPLGRQTIAEIETCRRRVDVDDLVALCKALETTPQALLGRSLA